MTALRIGAPLFKRIGDDLQRPHRFAAERVGFLFVRPDEVLPYPALLLPVHYEPVPEEGYVDDNTVGVRINSLAIRRALQRSLDTKTGVFHVHHHCCYGQPHFSSDDLEGWDRLIPSFCGSIPEIPHGALVIGFRSAAGLIWHTRNSAPVPISRISVVGFPVSIFIQ